MLRLAPVSILGTAAVMLLSGCGIVGGASATRTPTPTETATASPTATATSTPTATPTPEPTATPVPRSAVADDPVASDGLTLGQGRTAIVRWPAGGAATASLTFRGLRLPMLHDEGDFWLPIGVGPDTPVGAYALTIVTADGAGNAVESRTVTVNVVATDFPVEEIDVPPSQDNLLSPDEVQKELNIRAEVFARFTPEKLWSGPFILPVSGPVTSPFGISRSYNGAPVSSHHSGTDFGVAEGTPVMAAASGRVAFAGALTTRGNSVIIDHGLGVFTAYHHLSRIDVAEGQAIAQGQVLGAAGMTGLATGPHLHWELIVMGQNVDPTIWTYAGVAP
ncbi:MAG TPA: M23 family metallopeptidase [Dehalococcoidia bacterium]|nr:M23 family metallopeptidase [Dehalococcoidia bacterium]